MTQLTLAPELPSSGGPGVYYVTDGIRIKIGYTERPPRRRGGELKTELILFIPGDMDTERREHRRWDRYCINGEWFEAARGMLVWLGIRVDRTDWRAIRALEWLATNLEGGHAA